MICEAAHCYNELGSDGSDSFVEFTQEDYEGDNPGQYLNYSLCTECFHSILRFVTDLGVPAVV